MKLMVEKDKYYNKINTLPVFHTEDVNEYCKLTVEQAAKDALDDVPKERGEKCPFCEKYTAFSSLLLLRRGDEGVSLVLNCVNPSCGQMKVLAT